MRCFTVLTTDIFHDTIPASLIVDLIPVSRCVDDVQLELHAILQDCMRLRVDLGCRSRLMSGLEAALGLDEVRCEEGIDQCGLAQTSLT